MTLQVYKEDGSTVLLTTSPLFKEPKRIVYDEFQEFQLDQLVREYKNSGSAFTPLRNHELLQVFPEGKPFITKDLKEVKAKLNALREEENELNGKRATMEVSAMDADFVLAGIEAHRERLLEKKAKLDNILMFTNKKKAKAQIDYAMSIQRAKEHPIDSLIEVKRNQAVCLWHNDSDPSLHYYKKNNRVHCFVCDKGWDAIDVAMKVYDCDLKQAVAKLTNQ